ncbi:MAG: EamA family transporter [Bdellovibrionaceae bacterium]|nr:EamA family transporter [Pseudobdellovibrionaceae bacterium]
MSSLRSSEFSVGVLFILLAGICFGSLGIFGKLFISTGLDVGHVLSIRFLFAAALLGMFFIGLKVFKGINLFVVSKRQFLTCLLLGVLGYAVFSSFYFISFRYLSVGISAMILFTFPIFVFLGSVLFFKHPFDRRVVVALLVALFGLFLLLKDEFEVRSALGVYAGMAAAMSYSAYVILSDRYQKNIHPLTSSFYVMLSAGITLALIYQPNFDHFFGQNFLNMKLFVGLSIIGTIAPLSLFLAGLQRIPGPQASILVMIEPITASILAYFVFHEAMSLWQMVGIGLVVLADVIIVRLR